jgi:hypothetical protein
MACDTPFDAFRMATEALGDDIYYQASFRDIAINLIPRSEFPRGIGLTQSTFTLARSEPTDDLPDFDPITVSDMAGPAGLCATTYQDVPVGFTERTYTPEKFGWKGPVVCSDDLIYNFKAERFLSGYIAAIGKHTIRTIGNRLWAIYDHLVPKFVANESSTTVAGGTGAPPKVPGLTLPISLCHLDQSMLDSQAIELMEVGATDPDSNGWINFGDEGPIFPLLIGPQASKNLQLNNAELRQDYRWADPMPLLKRLGATRVIGNFRHVINLFPPRYNYDGTKYVRVPTWLMPAATKGQKAVINTEWEQADFEGARILSPWVFHDEVIRPVNAAAGVTFGPKNYMGEWQFVVGGDNISTTKCFDPLQKLGAHFAEYHHAPRPIFPEYGRLLIFKRCQQNFACTTCS